jgi:hypothetical protein
MPTGLSSDGRFFPVGVLRSAKGWWVGAEEILVAWKATVRGEVMPSVLSSDGRLSWRSLGGRGAVAGLALGRLGW